MQVLIKPSGFVQAVSMVKAIGEAGKALGGDIAVWGSGKPYAGPIERGKFLTGPRAGQSARRAGPAQMFAKGSARAIAEAPGIILPAISKGAGSVGQAKRKVRDNGVRYIRELTPVESGDLRESIGVLTRPGTY